MDLKNKIVIIPRKLLSDPRGAFLKVIRGDEANLPPYTGEVYVTWAEPEASRGGHYHTLAGEWFTLLSGKCLLLLQDTEDNEEMKIEIDSSNPATYYIPKRVAHRFDNVSKVEKFILLAYTDRLYDPLDTTPFEFSPAKL